MNMADFPAVRYVLLSDEEKEETNYILLIKVFKQYLDIRKKILHFVSYSNILAHM